MTIASHFSSAFNIEGQVKLEPPFPEIETIEVPAEHQAECGTEKKSPRLQVSEEGGVANAVVWIEGIENAPPPSFQTEYRLDQKNCEFAPHVVLIPQGATLSIYNSDSFLHDVRAFNERSEMLFNDAMPRKGQVLKKRFDEAGKLVVRCGLHKWMHAVVIVQDHPFYTVSDESGLFRLEGIPEGRYALKVWHESLGELEAEIGPESPPLILTYPKR